MEKKREIGRILEPEEIGNLAAVLETGVLPSLLEVGNMLTKAWKDPAGETYVRNLLPHFEEIRSAKERLRTAEENMFYCLEEMEKQQGMNL